MCRSEKTEDLHSGHGNIHCNPGHNQQQSDWGFQIQHLSEQTDINIKEVMCVNFKINLHNVIALT